MHVDGSFKSLLQGISQQPDRARLDGQCSIQENMMADPVDGLRRRPPVSYVTNIGTYHADNRIYNYNTGLEEYIIIFGYDKSVSVFELDGTPVTVNNQGASYLPTNPREKLRLVTIGDYTLASNVLVDTALTPDVHATTSGALIYFKDGGEYGRTYDVTIDGTLEGTYTTPGGSAPATEAAQTGTTYVATQIYNALVASAPAGYTFELKENVILVKRTSGSTSIDIQVSDDRGNLFAVIVQRETKKTSDLSLYAEPGMVVVITGEGSNAADDIYMEATGSGTGLQEVVWRETVARDLQYKFDEDTMPHALVRLADGTFYFGPLDESTHGGTTIERWRERDAGDDDSNPVRAFVGKPVEFIASFQERLVFLAGDILVMSSTKSFFNFWNTTATALLKSDPVELINPATKATSLKVALQHSKNLVVFSEDTQFIVDGRSGVTPETAALSIATKFQADLTATPVAAGSNVFFPITYGTYGGVRELFTDSITAAQDSRKITEHIKRLIAGGITHMEVSSNLGLLVLLATEEVDRVYIYQYLWDGETRLQSAWSYWTFGEQNIEHFFFSSSDLWFIAQDDTEYAIGAMDTTDSNETNLDFNVYLDRKERVTPVSKVITITGMFIPMDNLIVVQADDSNYPGMSVQVESVVGGVITLKTDPGGDVYLGRKYTSRYRPTMPLIKDQNGVAITTNKLTIGSFHISFKDTGRFKVDVADEWSTTTTQEFSGRILGNSDNVVGEVHISTGSFTAGIFKDRDYGLVDIYTDSYLPMSLVDLEWVGQFTKRGRRF